MRLLGLVTLVVLAGCSSAGREAAWEKSEPVPRAAGTSTASVGQLTDAEAAWALRDDKAQLEKALKIYEAIVAKDAGHGLAMTKLSRAYYFLVDAHLSLNDAVTPEDRLAVLQKGVDWGERALLVLDPSFEKKMRAGVEFDQAIKDIEKPAIEAAYWYCANLARFAHAKGLAARLFHKDRIGAAMERIAEIEPNFFHSAVDRLFGSYYAGLPSVGGRDLEKAKIHFDQALKASPGYLGNKLLMADLYAVNTNDRALYQKLLKEVIASPDGDDPDIAPENRAAKRHAEKLLNMTDERF